MQTSETNITVEPRPTPIAPHSLVLEVVKRSGRSFSTVRSVLYGQITSGPVSRVIAQVKKELSLGGNHDQHS